MRETQVLRTVTFLSSMGEVVPHLDSGAAPHPKVEVTERALLSCEPWVEPICPGCHETCMHQYLNG